MEDDRSPCATAADAPADLTDVDVARLRAWRDEQRVAERRLSYLRRVLQGHLDLALDEVDRRRGDHGRPLVARVADALTGPHAAGSARAVGLYPPAEVPGGTEAGIPALPDLDDAELDALVAHLRARERELSDARGVLLAQLDRLQDELVARYRDRRATIEDAVATLGRH